jgi:radical SAM protein with 4Fe4S-binding SPASM domain
MASIELTYRCNLKCAHCYLDVVQGNELTYTEWKDVLDQLVAAGTIYLQLTGGEILVRDDFLDIAGYAHRLGLILSLITNSTLVTQKIAQDIARLNPLHLGTSLYGATAATHEAVTRIPGSFEKTLRGIQHFIDAGLRPVALVTVMKSNYHEVNQIRELVASLGAGINVSSLLVPSKTGDDYPLKCGLNMEEYIASEIHETTIEGAEYQLCKAGKALCSFTPAGDVYPCLSFPLKLGNVRESSFESIWSLEPCAELRYLRSMRLSDLYACNECDLSAYCQRCTGSTYLETGRIDGPSPSACRRAEMRRRLSQAAEV